MNHIKELIKILIYFVISTIVSIVSIIDISKYQTPSLMKQLSVMCFVGATIMLFFALKYALRDVLDEYNNKKQNKYEKGK